VGACVLLERVNLEGNAVKSLHEVEALAPLLHLRDVNLRVNPVSDLPKAHCPLLLVFKLRSGAARVACVDTCH
jgi:hypothetical protein